MFESDKSRLKILKYLPLITIEETEGLEVDYKWNEVESINRRLFAV